MRVRRDAGRRALDLEDEVAPPARDPGAVLTTPLSTARLVLPRLPGRTPSAPYLLDVAWRIVAPVRLVAASVAG